MTTSIILSGSVAEKFNQLNFKNNNAIVLSARQGVTTKVFYDFAEYIKMPEKKLASLLHLSSRTISNYNELQKKMDPIQSEHLLKLISLFAKGEQIFGNVTEFNYWLQKNLWNADEKPIEWLVTPGGVDLVMDSLDQLAHAYVV